MNLMEKYRSKLEALKPEQPKSISPERQKTLDMCMTAIILSFRDEIIKIGRWRPSPETRQVEGDIEKSQHEILEGRGNLIDFRKACEKWKATGTREG